jgi:curved DNA-binding protein
MAARTAICGWLSTSPRIRCFDIVGHNLEIVLPLAPWEAALGAKVTVPTLKESILLTVPPGSQAGQRLRIKGKDS